MSILINRANIAFLINIFLVLFLKTDQEVESPVAYLAVLVFAEVLFLVKYIKVRRKSAIDIAFITFLLLGIWESAYKLGFTHPVLVPAPENVFYVFIEQKELMLAGVVSSLVLLAWGVGLAVILGVFLGLFTGWIPRFREAVVPIANVISPIPPLVYTPYVVAVMPTFKIASIFVIFSAVFWPTFQTMIARVSGMDPKIIQSAKVMNVSNPKMLFQVILPYTLPDIIGGLPGTLRGAFLCLTGAELLGATSGLGYFVKKFSDYADYTNVIAGIVLMGIVVTIIDVLVKKLESSLIKWK